jgi:hypothetical protein
MTLIATACTLAYTNNTDHCQGIVLERLAVNEAFLAKLRPAVDADVQDFLTTLTK